VFTDQADVAKVNHLMRTTDVHPPLYFWALSVWRNVAGSDLSALRGFSIIFALATLLVWMQIAWVAGLPPLILGSILALSYGFEITSHIVRGYALAQFFLALAVWAAIAGRSPLNGWTHRLWFTLGWPGWLVVLPASPTILLSFP
jgi:hypothetical protein